MDTINNINAGQSPYGYPLASFDDAAIVVSGRVVIANAILWDAEYGHYRASGWYAKKDGTRGRQIAKPLMFLPEVPTAILEALEPLIAA